MKTARELNGYTVEEAAKRCRISKELLMEIENDSGNAPISVARKLLQLYDIPAWYIFWESKEILA